MRQRLYSINWVLLVFFLAHDIMKVGPGSVLRGPLKNSSDETV